MEYLRLVQSPVTVWLPPVWSEAWPIARAGGFLVSLTPISLVTVRHRACRGAGFLIWLMKATGFGRAWRAYADDAAGRGAVRRRRRRLLIRTTSRSPARWRAFRAC